jgi:tetratricopeptide (TPR) repeat protein
VRLNVGALACLAWSAAHSKPDGFILINDFGPVTAEELPRFAALQRFGKTIGTGLSFPWLEAELARRGLQVLKATGDDTHVVHARLVGARLPPATARTFEDRFSTAAAMVTEGLLDEARQHVAAGRKSEALHAYRQVMARHRFNWALLGEVAEFLNRHINDYAVAVDVARLAVEINPHYSTGLWNVLGDALYNLGKHAEAHDAYLRAERVDARDPSTNLNLAYTYLQAGAHGAALEVIRRGLEHDVRGQFRERLLDKQRQVLDAISEKHAAEEARLARRNERLL